MTRSAFQIHSSGGCWSVCTCEHTHTKWLMSLVLQLLLLLLMLRRLHADALHPSLLTKTTSALNLWPTSNLFISCLLAVFLPHPSFCSYSHPTIPAVHDLFFFSLVRWQTNFVPKVRLMTVVRFFFPLKTCVGGRRKNTSMDTEHTHDHFILWAIFVRSSVALEQFSYCCCYSAAVASSSDGTRYSEKTKPWESETPMNSPFQGLLPLSLSLSLTPFIPLPLNSNLSLLWSSSTSKDLRMRTVGQTNFWDGGCDVLVQQWSLKDVRF